ncbi:hypothetical protein HMPREF9614_02553 [Cutibacterium acnes HL002PA2]|nr:hypothetical protein HMPREF9614_02553 [Cutibacterium acnes HL002PA2]
MVGCSHPWHDTGQTDNGTDDTSLCHCENSPQRCAAHWPL